MFELHADLNQWHSAMRWFGVVMTVCGEMISLGRCEAHVPLFVLGSADVPH